MRASGIDFSRILFFGDSLTDNGNLYGISRGTEPPSPPYAQRFSNGETYAEVLPGLIGVASNDFGPEGWSFAGDDNFAYGGARAVTNADPVPDLQAQLAEFRLRYPDGAPDDTAAALLIGNNDYFGYDGSDPAAFVGRVLGQVALAAQQLVTPAALGGGNVDKLILFTLPNLAATPLVAFNPASAALDGLIDAHNAGLRTVAAQLTTAGANVEIVDISAFTREIAADATTFGFNAPLQQPVVLPTGFNPAVAGFDADEIAFFDFVHPTAAAHGVNAAFTAASLAADTVTFAAAANDRFDFDDGRDVVFASAGNDRVSTGDDDDVVFGGIGNDRIETGSGNDVAAGGSGNDTVRGGSGVDVVAGNDGDDWLDAGSGADIVIAGTGRDRMFTGSGDDRLYIVEDTVAGFDLADGGSGFDTLMIEVDAWSADLSADLTAFTSGGFDRFASVGVFTRDIERVEVMIDGVFVASAGDTAPVMSTAQSTALASADLWGLL